MDAPSEPPLVGREEELAVLRAAIDAARAGRGRVVVIEGAPGSGKSRLVREAAAEARRQGLRVVWLPESGTMAAAVIEAALDDAVRGRPVVIAHDRQEIDDVRPEPLASIAERSSRVPVLVVLTRYAPPGAFEPQASEMHVSRLQIRPLRPGAVIALAARMGVGTSLPVLERLHAATGGNALLAVETLAALSRTDALAEAAEPWPLSERSVLWVRARLDALSPDRRDAVEVASVLGEECDVALVARVVGEAEDPAQALAALTGSAFTVSPNGGQRCRFVPPLVRDLVYASLSAERRTELHSRVAAALAANGTTSPALLAHRSLAASAAGDARRGEYYLARLVQGRARSDTPASPSGWPYFVLEGEHWAIGFGDRVIRLNARAGLLYLARLLARPGVEFAALALGDPTRARDAPETVPDPTMVAERARVRVTRRIRDGIARIARAHPDLGAHLEHTIRTGAQCVYAVDPVSAPRWEVRWSP